MKFRYYVTRRLLLTVVVLWGVSLITFLLTHAVPSDPAALWAGSHATAEQIEQARQALGLNRSLHIQYADFLTDLFRGDLGTSIRTEQPVMRDLVAFFPATVELVFVSMLFAIGFGIPLGIISAKYHNTAPDHASRVVSMSGVSLPVFWLGMLLQLVLYGWLGVLPLEGRVATEVVQANPLSKITGMILFDSLVQGNVPVFLSAVEHIVLPAFTLSFASMAIITRMTRSSMLETMQEEYVDVHKGFGLSERTIVYKYALKNSMNSVLTVIGLSFGYLLGGSILVESIFSWPGLGRYIVNSIYATDYPAVMGVTLLFATSYILINLLVDLTYAYLNPKLRASGGGG